MSRAFPLGTVLSVTTGLLLAPDHIGGVHELLDYLTGDTLFTHQLPRVMDEAKPAVLAQHPDLAAIEPPDFSDDPTIAEAEVEAFVAGLAERYGAIRELEPMDPADHTRIDPISELRLRGLLADRIIVVDPGDGGS